jgi:DHA1 family inner membrane transport protein
MGRAISGFAVSAALGVPLGTLVGQALGWRGSFLAIVALSLLALVLVPSVPSTGGGAGRQARHAFAPRVLAGGRFADQNAARTVIAATVGVAVCLLALHLGGVATSFLRPPVAETA